MFRNLIPLIATHFHVISPDLPGFGFTTVSKDYIYTFNNLTTTIFNFVKAISLSKYILYIFDYGSPVGLRLALKDPSSVSGLIVQNGNAYEEGLDDRFWDPLREYWRSDQNNLMFLEKLEGFVQDPKNVTCQYYDGVPNPEIVDPSGYTLDIALIERPNQPDIQVKLFYDYKNNVAMYPKFQEFFRSCDFPVLVAWGKNDIIFTAAGAEAYKKDLKNVTLRFYDTGHFALETHASEIAHDIIQLFGPSTLPQGE
ncbi:LANO_0D00254g1_1 [Lachancea nothofagi CBS 11611]|uniref:LANO_0D00254g1_1 n=1 Tax=Lachancea nothofagi CBS 11611 TaxID=1266666 RepID=A0A1G4JCU0_9SACH|nr:LANO_0D00254g1_1 [Lachancea nothofagi CBS 11611]